MSGNFTSNIPASRLASFGCVLVLVLAINAAAQSAGGPTANQAPPLVRAVLTHDADGGVIIRATRVTQPIRIDGRLDEEAYAHVPPITEFIQQVPDAGNPVTERTQMWVLFDDTNIYVACRCWHEQPERIFADDMRRDISTSSHDHIGILFDTFHDQRTGFVFYVSAIGALRDGLVADLGFNFDWNAVWNSAAGRFSGGWIAEMAFPFKTLRYGPGREQTWGIQLRRGISQNNEMAYITLIPPTLGTSGIGDGSLEATLVGLEAPPAVLNLEVKPYGLLGVTTDRLSQPAVSNDATFDAGIDLKYGLTKSLTADFTYNTDFAQVEADEAQVNLTRFRLSFPEKREFFLEGRGIFLFGRGLTGGFRRGDGDAPTIFYSRRIGLSNVRAVPVIGGARLTGKVGSWNVGVLSMETGEDAAVDAAQTNFSVVRLRRDILRRSNLGGIFTRRSISTVAPGANHVWGLDGNFAFYRNVYFNTFLAQSRTEGQTGDDLSYRTQFNYNADRYGLTLDRLVVEPNFNPEVGLLRRQNFRRNFIEGRFSPRPANHPLVRKWISQASLEYITDDTNRLESRALTGEFETEFHSGYTAGVQYARLHEFVPEPFSISSGVSIPAGGYSFQNLELSFTSGRQHRVNGSATLDIGSFYDGDKTTATFRGRGAITPQLGAEPNISLNWVDLPQGQFTATVVGARTTYTLTPRMFVAALVQYSSSSMSLSTNLRFRWEYQPGSEVFFVYSEGRSTLPVGRTELENRGFVVKINRLFRF